MRTYEFAIQKTELNNGKINYTPVTRIKSKFITNPWVRIACIYGIYLIMDLDFDPELTLQQCEEHIQGYKDSLQKARANQIKNIELTQLIEHSV